MDNLTKLLATLIFHIAGFFSSLMINALISWGLSHWVSEDTAWIVFFVILGFNIFTLLISLIFSMYRIAHGGNKAGIDAEYAALNAEREAAYAAINAERKALDDARDRQDREIEREREELRVTRQTLLDEQKRREL